MKKVNGNLKDVYCRRLEMEKNNMEEDYVRMNAKTNYWWQSKEKSF